MKNNILIEKNYTPYRKKWYTQQKNLVQVTEKNGTLTILNYT